MCFYILQISKRKNSLEIWYSLVKRGDIMGKFLQQCADDAWDVIQGRKKVVGNKVVEVTDDTEGKEIEYGWLEPSGKFHIVEFGKHQAWASKYISDLYYEGKISYEESNLSNGQDSGDVLVNRGWVLIHNPSQRNIKITRDLSKRLTKAQADYLYDFLRKHGKEKEANELYQ